MTPYTLTVSEAETQQLRNLVKRTQTTHRPIMLTNEELAEPIAVLVESSVFETLQRKERQLFHLQLRQLLQAIATIETQWDEPAARQEFIATFAAGVTSLWKAAPENTKDLCVTLDLAARRLSLQRVTLPQIAALRNCLELLQDGTHDDVLIAQCEQRLIASGLPPTIGGSALLVEAYMNDL